MTNLRWSSKQRVVGFILNLVWSVDELNAGNKNQLENFWGEVLILSRILAEQWDESVFASVLFPSDKDRDALILANAHLRLESLNGSENLFDKLFLIFTVLGKFENFLFFQWHFLLSLYHFLLWNSINFTQDRNYLNIVFFT